MTCAMGQGEVYFDLSLTQWNRFGSASLLVPVAHAQPNDDDYANRVKLQRHKQIGMGCACATGTSTTYWKNSFDWDQVP